MTNAVLGSLADSASELARRQIRFALVGGLAVSVRGEPRFTADVALAIAVPDDAALESLVRELRACGYEVRALVEHETRGRLATVRLRSMRGVVVDLIAASGGIELEVVEAAAVVRIGEVGEVPVASAEDLLAMKVLAVTPRRDQDRIDARSLLLVNPELDLDRVRARLDLVRSRGFHRDQDLHAKLNELVADAEADRGD